MKTFRRLTAAILAWMAVLGAVEPLAPAMMLVPMAVVQITAVPAAAMTQGQKIAVLNGTPSWVLRTSGTLPSIDIDFANNRAWVGGVGVRAPPSLLTTTRASTGYAQWADGHLSSFAANTPRITDLGLLVEQAATNLIIQSQTLDNAAWAASHVSVTANVDTAPDGTLTADKIVTTNADTNFHQVNATAFTATGGSAYTATAYLKASGWRYGFINVFYGGASHNYAVSFDLQAGAKSGFFTGNTATPTFAITQAANGFWRVSVTSTDATGGATTVSIGALNAAGDFSAGGTGDGVSGVIAWGAQAELGAVATSYIPTTTVAVTRAEDAVTFNNLNLPAPYSLFFSVGSSAKDSADLLLGGTVNDASLLRISGTTGVLNVIEAGVTTASITAGTMTVNTPFKVAGRFAVNDTNLALGGTLGTRDTSTTPPRLTALGFGRALYSFGSAVGSVYFTRATAFRAGLPDAQLQAVSK